MTLTCSGERSKTPQDPPDALEDVSREREVP